MRPLHFLLLPAALALGAANKGDGALGAKAASETAIVTLEPLAVAIVDNGQVTGQLRATLAVRGADADLLTERLPLLRSALLAEMSEFGRLRGAPYEAVDAAALAQSLDRAARRAVPESREILLLQVAAVPV